jgi:hypothetical protein
MSGVKYYLNQSNAINDVGSQQSPSGNGQTTIAYNASSGPNPILVSPYTNPGFVFAGWTLESTTDINITTPFGASPGDTIIQGQTIDGTTFEYRLYPNWNPAPPAATGVKYYLNQSNAINDIGSQQSLSPNGQTAIAYNASSGPDPILVSPYTNPGFLFAGWILQSTTDTNITAPAPVSAGVITIQGQSINGGTFEYRLYPTWNIICFRQGSNILVHEHGNDTYKPVETLRPGTLVKTLRDGYLPISVIGHSQIYNPGNAQRSKNRLYKLSPANYPTLMDDLYLTGCHSILVDTLTPIQEEEIREDYHTIFVTDKKYRLPAYLDEKAAPHEEEGNFTIWHFALEGEDVRKNHGVFANGLLVESSFRKHVETRGGMTLIE